MKRWVGRIFLGRDDNGRQTFEWVGRFPTRRARDRAVAKRMLEREPFRVEASYGKASAMRLVDGRIVLRSRTYSTHGHTRGRRSPTYVTWQSMLARCTNPRHHAWEHYGGRGIAICDRWLSFEMFLEDMGERPEGKTLDRKDVNGNYEPGNCRWATGSEQVANQRPRRGKRDTAVTQDGVANA